MFASLVKSIKGIIEFKDADIDKTVDVKLPESVVEPLSREQYWESQLLEKTIGFDPSDCMDYFAELHRRAIEFGLSVDLNNEKAALNNDEAKLLEMRAAISGEKVEHVSTEKDKRTIDDLISQYTSETYKSLDSFFDPFYKSMGDGCKYVVTSNDWFESKGKKKIKGAGKSYAHHPAEEPSEYVHDVLVLFDTTLFGSGGDGMTLTSEFVAFKGLGKDKEFIFIGDIESVGYDRGSKELTFNDIKYNYVHTELNGPAKRVFECLQAYINQPSLRLKKYINNK
ncbi:hypothetical protein H5300_24800 [Vibrio sp. SG41-7]|uniref:hypothetical protein n=1 Tax=Vibrio sp. SG41-7 TaxID=2760973 RepID=UPI0015FF1F7B|nr:hypothetical protein [Vibrio sp. SG41-7]MBB1466434.1 hypothetical protein [Vibrio sp. SG41-7]